MSESGQSGRGGEFFVLAEALRNFKSGPLTGHPSDRVLAETAGVSPSTIGDWLRGTRFPHDIGKVLIVVRVVRAEAAARGIRSPASGPEGLLEDDCWRAAHREERQRRAGLVSSEVQRAQAVSLMAGPGVRVRVSQADLRRLGVHAAISVQGVPDEVPPEYVPRDTDTAEHGIRATVTAAASRGGFVLLVGGSSVGKTRCAAEAVKELLPDWWLVHPASPGEVAALAAAPLPRTVVWLDEVQRYLDGEQGMSGGTVRALLRPPGPVVIIGTLWPDRYAAYTPIPVPGEADLHVREREVVNLATVIRIGPDFSPAEQRRAHEAATRDPRLKVALTAGGYGLTQTLAAAPLLVVRWEDAQAVDPYAWAVLTAALDAARFGARAPLSAEFLGAAAPGYCTPRQQAEAPGNWFEKALAYATKKLHGAAAALAPAAAGMGQVARYTVADYLLQYASRERRAMRVPASTWDALLAHVRDPADAARCAGSAEARLLYHYAIPLYRYAADAGDQDAANLLARLLALIGDLDGLQARAADGDGKAAVQLAGLLAERGNLDGLRARADAGDGAAADALVGPLTRLKDSAGLRALADAGNGYAACRLAGLLAERGDLDEAEQILRPPADAGDQDAAYQLAMLLAERGNLDGLRARADAGDGAAAWQLASRLAERGDLDGLRACADAGDIDAAWELANLLAERGDLDEAEQILRPPADTGAPIAADRLADLLAERGDLDGLRARADADDVYAADRLADLLAERGDLDGLRARADAGDGAAALALAGLLAVRGDLDGLRARADAGDWAAARHLAGLLAVGGDLDGLRARADAGDRPSASRLADLLAERGDLDEAERILRASSLGTEGARQLANLLTKRGRSEEAGRLLRFGLTPDGLTASG